MRVLVACEYSGTVRDAFLARGHDAISCDLLPTDKIGPHHQGDVRPIPGFDGYLVSSSGKILSCKTTRGLRDEYKALRPSTDAKGYLGLTICGDDGKRLKVRVHRLVAEIFLPNPEDLPCVRHLNGNPQDNRSDNLAWGSYSDNEQDKKNHGTYDLRRNGKLSPRDRTVARKMVEEGSSHQEVSLVFNVSRPTISRLVRRKTWEIDHD
jgi:hypothetical protein